MTSTQIANEALSIFANSKEAVLWAIAEERRQCAMLCEEESKEFESDNNYWDNAMKSCADLIRNR